MASRGSYDALHVETSNLHVELCAALKEDASRKKTDEMKKRAIHTAASYDEFRHMVSCAQLIPVTRKEMEMLSDQKRGWHGRSGGVIPATKIPGRRVRKTTTGRALDPEVGILSDGSKTRSICAPSDFSQFQRDWRRRYRTDNERREYLRAIGTEKIPNLFRVEMEPDVLGQVLSLICGEFPVQSSDPRVDSSPTQPRSTANRSGDGIEDKTDGVGGPDSENSSFGKSEAQRCMEWLWALSKTSRFGVNMLFLKDKERLAVARVLDLIAEYFSRNGQEEDADKLHSLRKVYAM